jgi:hypothetical protein
LRNLKILLKFSNWYFNYFFSTVIGATTPATRNNNGKINNYKQPTAAATQQQYLFTITAAKATSIFIVQKHKQLLRVI